jgi:hypothetical protein
MWLDREVNEDSEKDKVGSLRAEDQFPSALDYALSCTHSARLLAQNGALLLCDNALGKLDAAPQSTERV